MKRRRGKLTTILVTVIAIALLAAAGYFGLGAVSARSAARGEEYLASGSFADAKDCFEKAKKYSLRPNAKILTGLGKTEIALEEYDDAQETYAELAALEPDNVDAHYMLGQLYVRVKNFDGARKQIKILRSISTEEARDCADKLEEQSSTGMVKGFFKNLLDKIAPGLKVPGLEDKPETGTGEVSKDGTGEAGEQGKTGKDGTSGASTDGTSGASKNKNKK